MRTSTTAPRRRPNWNIRIAIPKIRPPLRNKSRGPLLRKNRTRKSRIKWDSNQANPKQESTWRARIRKFCSRRSRSRSSRRATTKTSWADILKTKRAPWFSRTGSSRATSASRRWSTTRKPNCSSSVCFRASWVWTRRKAGWASTAPLSPETLLFSPVDATQPKLKI